MFGALYLLPLVAQTSILPSDSLSAFRLLCNGGRLERVAVEGGFPEAWRIATPPGVAREWDCRIRHTLAVPVAANDWLVAEYWVRAIESSDPDGATIKLNFERAGEDYRKSVNAGTLVTPYWRKMQIPFRIVESYQPGGAALDFWVGYSPQVVEIGGIAVHNYGPSPSPPVATLGFTYPGREPDAPWRAAAQERIEKYRKADLVVTAVDGDGKPRVGVPVKVRQKRHAFGFGSAVVAAGLLGTSPDDEIYRRKILELFNKTVLENDLKWPTWEANRARAANALAWLHANGLPDTRGHNMVWPDWQYLPNDLRALASNPDALRKRIDDHILEIGAATRGLVTDWDVVNEPIPNRVLQNILGDYELVRWFQLARAADPNVRLFVNEYDIETGGGRNVTKRRQFAELIQALQDRGAPLTGIGIQGHFGTDLTHPQKVYDIVDQYTKFGVPVQITEFDINSNDRQLQADYLRDYFTVVFSHPGVEAILMWGFWEGRHWRPDCALYSRDWTEREHGRAYRELVFKEWWTMAEGVTDVEGKFAVRGFLGVYDVEVDGVVSERKLVAPRGIEPLFKP